MSTENYYEGVSNVLHLTPQNITRCEEEECDVLCGSFEENVNHYINTHGFKILSSGPQTVQNENGELCHDPFVLLGR